MIDGYRTGQHDAGMTRTHRYDAHINIVVRVSRIWHPGIVLGCQILLIFVDPN